MVSSFSFCVPHSIQRMTPTGDPSGRTALKLSTRDGSHLSALGQGRAGATFLRGGTRYPLLGLNAGQTRGTLPAEHSESREELKERAVNRAVLE